MSGSQRNACAELENPRDDAENSNVAHASDERFKRRVAAVYGTWKIDREIDGRDGRYPHRSIAHCAQGDRWPLHNLDWQLKVATLGRVPTDRKKELVRLILERIDELEELERRGILTA